MLHVRASSSFYGVKVAVDDPIEILRHSLRDFMEFVVIERLRFLIDIFGEGDRREIAHGSFILVGVLQNFRTQVRTLNDTQILLVTFRIAGILIEHVWGSSLSLRLENSLPHVGGGDSCVSETLLLVLGVEFLKILTVHIRKTLRLVGTEEGPISTLLNSLHE